MWNRCRSGLKFSKREKRQEASQNKVKLKSSELAMPCLMDWCAREDRNMGFPAFWTASYVLKVINMNNEELEEHNMAFHMLYTSFIMSHDEISYWFHICDELGPRNERKYAHELVFSTTKYEFGRFELLGQCSIIIQIQQIQQTFNVFKGLQVMSSSHSDHLLRIILYEFLWWSNAVGWDDCHVRTVTESKTDRTFTHMKEKILRPKSRYVQINQVNGLIYMFNLKKNMKEKWRIE